MNDREPIARILFDRLRCLSLFEIRFARSLAMAGVAAEYEHGAGVGKFSVFPSYSDPLWLVELVSLRMSWMVSKLLHGAPAYGKALH